LIVGSGEAGIRFDEFPSVRQKLILACASMAARDGACEKEQEKCAWKARYELGGQGIVEAGDWM
jgi:hypothetical protein